MAGAMGLPFLPTRSLIGSDLGRDAEAAGLFKVVADPFGAGAGGPIGLVKALRPDISLAHAWATPTATPSSPCPWPATSTAPWRPAME